MLWSPWSARLSRHQRLAAITRRVGIFREDEGPRSLCHSLRTLRRGAYRRLRGNSKELDMRLPIVVGLGMASFLAIPAFANETKLAVVDGAGNCIASANAAALKAMERSGPLGQIYIHGDPVSLGPNHLRVDVGEFPGGEYEVDVNIDRSCRVLSVSTREESPNIR
jgi:hypothetical protein